MAESQTLGQVIWADLTVPDAAGVAAFYEAVVGWKAQAQEHEGGDFNMMIPGSGIAAAGVCYARGANAKLPPQWLIYVRVADVAKSVAECERRGGRVLGDVAGGKLLQDPAGAVMVILPG